MSKANTTGPYKFGITSSRAVKGMWSESGGTVIEIDGITANSCLVSVGEWNHIAFAKESGNAKLYLNGEDCTSSCSGGSCSSTATVDTSTIDLSI